MTDDDELEPVAVLVSCRDCHTFGVNLYENGEHKGDVDSGSRGEPLRLNQGHTGDFEALVAVSDLKDWLRGKKTGVCDEHRCKDQDIGWNQAIKILLKELEELQGDADDEK